MKVQSLNQKGEKMNKYLKIIITGVITITALKSEGRISGYMFGDYYYIPQHHDTLIENQNGFWIRRIYFTYDNFISESFSSRIRFEMRSSGDFKTKQNIVPFVKDAYLKWKIKNHYIIFGLSPTPTWGNIEKYWEYRKVEKTPLDIQKLGSSRDLGIAIKGYLDKNKKIKYHLMIANGEGTKSEINKQKKFYLSFSFYPSDNLFFEIYGDFLDAEGHNQIYTYQGFMGFKNKKIKIGLLFASQTHFEEPDTSINYMLGSGFLIFNLNPKITFILRYDKMFEKNPKGNSISYIPLDPSTPPNILITGVNFKIHENFHLIPNIEYVFYNEENGYKPLSDIYLKLTLFYKFK